MNRVSRGQLANRFFSKFHASPVTAAPRCRGSSTPQYVPSNGARGARLAPPSITPAALA
ncbi:hypothetical protein [Pseudomonas sp. S60]|uniref:hypothetical protein n=1 Tax=Pseudomonas sp. S60 TaxID=211124 RepID=UPI0019139185|nr:hypothetical protein [Pseudomonas sp. S60]